MDARSARGLTIGDGFRLGVGLIIAFLLFALVAVGALLEKGLLPDSVAQCFDRDRNVVHDPSR